MEYIKEVGEGRGERDLLNFLPKDSIGDSCSLLLLLCELSFFSVEVTPVNLDLVRGVWVSGYRVGDLVASPL